MNIQTALDSVVNGNSLAQKDMQAVMRSIMTGGCSDAQIAGFLIALRMKGETASEISAAASVMRELSSKVDVVTEGLVDIVGTGGDGAKLFNVSTASAFVAASAGCHVAKHGNRSVSSSSGSADLLEQAGVELNLAPAAVARCIEEIGVGFMFAVNHHSAMKYAIGPRKELATRTIFNVLGPMTNPATVTRQLLGVYDSNLLEIIAEAMRELGSEHVLVVHSTDGLDEISIAAPTSVCELKGGTLSSYSIEPEQFGLQRAALDNLAVDNAAESLCLIREAFDPRNTSARACSARDMISLNAGAAIYAAGLAGTLEEGVTLAQDSLGSGLPGEKMRELANFSQLVTGNG